MKKFTIVILLLIVISSCNNASKNNPKRNTQSSTHTDSSEIYKQEAISTLNDIDLIKSIEIKRLKSLVEADMKVAKPIHADDFQLINPSGRESSKATYLGRLESGEVDYQVWDVDSITVRMYKDVAVIRYVDKDFKVFVNGEFAWDGQVKHTNVYEKRNGQWQIVWSQASGGYDPSDTE